MKTLLIESLSNVKEMYRDVDNYFIYKLQESTLDDVFDNKEVSEFRIQLTTFLNGYPHLIFKSREKLIVENYKDVAYKKILLEIIKEVFKTKIKNT